MTEGKKGLSKGCLISIIVVGVLVIAAVALSILCIKNPDKLIEYGLRPIGSEIKNHLPDDFTPEMVDQYIDDFVQAFRDRKIDQEEIQKIMEMGRDFVSSQDLSEEELKEKAKKLLEEMKRAGEY
jgi:hypothetical protein